MSISTAIGSRHRTGETCPASGVYRFDGYLDGTSSPSPTADEREIALSKGETFRKRSICGAFPRALS